MPIFARSFAVDTLAEWDARHPGNGIRTLFERWALPGLKATSAAPLRLGVRNGYVNFYVKGQSVAKLSCGGNVPKLDVHQAYELGQTRGDRPASTEPGRTYVPIDASALADPAIAARINGWIETAKSYASAEKRFVDDLAAANPGIIDLEMGLPASEAPDSARVAPRMDIVIAQIVDGVPSVAFWEAKCANNPELRSTQDYAVRADGFSGPKVLDQLRKYVDWMAELGRTTQVAAAYQATAATLLQFHRLFGSKAAPSPECVAIWQALAAGNDPRVVVRPGIVIGNYWPEGCIEKIGSDRMRQAANSFARNGHREKLERHGTIVFETDSDEATLPILPIAAVSA